MALDELENDNNDKQNHERDLCSEVKSLLKARNEVIFGKIVKLDQANVEDLDLSDIVEEIGASEVKPNKTLKNKEMAIRKTIDEILELKRTSESQINFNVDESDVDDEVSKSMTALQQLSGKLFNKITDVQKEFNEHLNNNLVDYAENKNHISNHIELVQEICKFDKGIDAVIQCNDEKLKKSVKKNLKIDNIDNFGNVCNELAQDTLRTVYEDGAKQFKKHQHLSDIIQYNKPLKEMTVERVETAGLLDPFTQRLISKPVKNIVCGHMYDHDSVSQMFQHKLFIACPNIGCTNRRFTKKDILFDLNTSSNSNE